MSKRSRRSPRRPRTAISSETLNAVFSALAHPARRRILVALHARGGVMSAGEIADRFKHSWPTTTRHLGVLRRAGVLEVGTRGRHRFYALRPRVLVRAADWLYGWAARAEEGKTPARPAWTKLPYATMRNVKKP
ncbi:MAG: ArsR/SmtB family transcription factor [Planctomycetota bacterium]